MGMTAPKRMSEIPQPDAAHLIVAVLRVNFWFGHFSREVSFQYVI